MNSISLGGTREGFLIVTITYTLALDDVIAFNQHFAASRWPVLAPRRRRYDIAFQVVATVLVGLLALRFGVLGAIGGIAVWVGAYFAQGPLNRYLIAGNVRRLYSQPTSRDELGSRTVTLSDSELVSSSATVSSSYSWVAVQAVSVLPSYLFIYVAAGQAVIVPRRALPVRDDAEFLRVLRERVAASIVGDSAA